MERRPRDHVTEARWNRLGDATCIVVALMIGGLATDATQVEATRFADANAVLGLVAAVALWWRRRAPVVVAALTMVAAALAPFAAGAAVVSVFTVAAHRAARTALIVTAVYLVTGGVGMVLFPDQDVGALLSALMGLLLTLGALGWGFAARSRREVVAALTERAERAEAEQQLRVDEARRIERNRIAAEMHDVLAHRLSMLSLHAGAIELRPTAAAEDLTGAARVIRSNAHLALDELRTVIGVLRDDGDEVDPAPLPTAQDLEALLAESRAAGMDLDAAVSLDLVTVPPDLGRHLYRIVQEGLTNARKHAPAQPVALTVTGRPGADLHVEIRNPTPPAATPAVSGAGVGLVGLRERVRSLGGTLRVDRASAEVHRLEARLPWPAP